MRDLLSDLSDPETMPGRVTTMHRVIAGLIALGCLGMLGVAAWLDPHPENVGTHSQLGLPPCMWTESAGIPCPSCGMTTAYAHAADGRIDRAFVAQPFGAFLALVTAMTFWVAIYIAVVGAPTANLVARLWRPAVIWFLGVLALGSWLYKIWAYKQGF